MKKVLVTATNYSQYCAEAKRMLLDQGFEVIENPYGRPYTFEELRLVVGDIDAVVAGVDTWDEQVFQLAPKLKVIARFGVGIDNIDLIKARERGILVTNAKGMNANAVAEITVGLIIGALRNIPYLNRSLISGNWDRLMGRELKGRTVGLLGFGEIAQAVARKLSGFEVNICAYDKYPNDAKAAELGVTLVEANEVLQGGDVVCMLLPSLKETYRMMSAPQFAMMKDQAYFINTARGALVDEQALHAALVSGKLAGAAIDVYEVEPIPPTNPLLLMDSIICTPHTAAETYETYEAVSLETAGAIIDVFSGRTPRNLLN